MQEILLSRNLNSKPIENRPTNINSNKILIMRSITLSEFFRGVGGGGGGGGTEYFHVSLTGTTFAIKCHPRAHFSRKALFS